MTSVITYQDTDSIDGRNVQDRFYNMTTEQIKEALEVGRSKMVNVCMNLTSDFNKSSIVRANNAFLGREVWIVSENKHLESELDEIRSSRFIGYSETVKHADSLKDLIDLFHADGYFVWAVDNVESYNPNNVYDVELPEKSVFVYGEERNGLSKTEIDICDGMIFIPMVGAARSLNVSQAAAIIMSEYTRQHRVDL